MVAFVPTQLALAFVGFLIAQALAINALALPLFVAPLVVARQLYHALRGPEEASLTPFARSLVRSRQRTPTRVATPSGCPSTPSRSGAP